MNPNQIKNELDTIDLRSEHNFPYFINKINISKFRNINNLNLDFIHPVTVLSGTNKIGKTSILAMLACSHIEFQMRNSASGLLERCTWMRLIRFTRYDIQNEDWEYSIEFKNGKKIENRTGKRQMKTGKWSGVAKKESQIEIRKVVYIDLDRINPARSYSHMLFLNTQNTLTATSLDDRIQTYFSYIFEEDCNLSRIAKYQNKETFSFNNSFTNFNSASGEDVVLSILLDAVEADKKSLILIDELELGLHPRVQRRLAEVILDISIKDQKQFIVTTHSPTLLSFFNQKSRIFIQKELNGDYKSISKISIPAAFSKMDSEVYPLVNLFCEDDISKKIILKSLEYINQEYSDIQKIINIIVPDPGSASNLKKIHEVNSSIHKNLKIKTGYISIIDGDQKPFFGEDVEHSHFLFSDEAPEKFLLRNYLEKNENSTLSYHLNNSNPHILFGKCIQENIAPDNSSLFEKLYSEIASTQPYQNWLESFKKFIIKEVTHFSEQYD